MELISRDELKQKLDQKDDFKLAMVMGDWHFRAMHIPGSLNISALDVAKQHLDINDEIVVYCSNDACLASRIAYDLFVTGGYKNVRRYAGGITDWNDAGYPVEGDMAQGQLSA